MLAPRRGTLFCIQSLTTGHIMTLFDSTFIQSISEYHYHQHSHTFVDKPCGCFSQGLNTSKSRLSVCESCRKLVPRFEPRTSPATAQCSRPLSQHGTQKNTFLVKKHLRPLTHCACFFVFCINFLGVFVFSHHFETKVN